MMNFYICKIILNYHNNTQLDELNLVHLNTQTIEPMIKKTILTQRITFIILSPQIVNIIQISNLMKIFVDHIILTMDVSVVCSL